MIPKNSHTFKNRKHSLIRRLRVFNSLEAAGYVIIPRVVGGRFVHFIEAKGAANVAR